MNNWKKLSKEEFEDFQKRYYAKIEERKKQRYHYAGLAMNGLIASCDWNVSKLDNGLIIATAENSVKLADELLKQLENK